MKWIYKNLPPDNITFEQLLITACERFNISIKKAKRCYGSYSIMQWEILLNK